METWSRLLRSLDAPAAGARAHLLARELYPLPRSMTGDGVRETLRTLARELPVACHEVPSGTEVLDWQVPPEWNVREAWLTGPDGRRLVDLRSSTLHVVGYSLPVRDRMTLAELRPHLHSDPGRPHAVPYRTAYYRRDWGLCLPHEQLVALPEGEYEVVIDATLEPGSLTYGEALLPGAEESVVLVSAHVCHPSLANDNLSGIVVAAVAASILAGVELRHTYRFVFAPATIGPITWLARNRRQAERIVAGLVLAGVGDPGPFTYKQSRHGDAVIDRAVAVALRDAEAPHRLRDFTPDGYDERQYCSPGFDLPVGCLMRTPPGEYPEYHTSDDDLDLVRPDSLGESIALVLRIVAALETNDRLLGTVQHGEPMLARHGLDGSEDRHVLAWVLNLADGRHDTLAIAERSGLSLDRIEDAVARARTAGLLQARSTSFRQ